ncbi:glycosyltransferase family 2 protein [Ferruginibacter profundus]
MEVKPLVSIICVSMNHEKYILQGVSSFTGQTYPDIEFLYVDNNSSDKTFEIADKIFSASARPYRGFKRERSFSLPANFNLLVKEAKGDYLCFISCDDWMEPGFIAAMVEQYQQQPNAGLVYSNGWRYYEDTGTSEIAADKKFISGRIFDHIFLNGVIFPVGVMIKKEVIAEVGLFDETLPIEDYDMWLKIASRFEIAYSATPLIYYRLHKKSLSHLHGNKNIKYYLQIADKYKGNKLYKRVCRNFRKFSIYEQFQSGNNKQALQLIKKDFRFERFYFSVLLKMLLGKKS